VTVGSRNNNQSLIDQIKLRIQDTYIEQLKQYRKGTLEFFIRDNNVQIAYPTQEKVFVNGEVVDAPQSGITREQIKNLLKMVECALTDAELYYCTILIHYVLLDEKDVQGTVQIRSQQHYKWR
jgi:hypothetical protein